MTIKRFRDWSILLKIMAMAIICVSLVTILILGYFLPYIEKKFIQEGTKHVVEVAYGILSEYDNHVKTGQITLAVAKEQAAQAVHSIRYKEKEYFWINDLASRMIMHPINPALNGKDLSDYKDPTGKLLFQEFVRVCMARGAGFVDYQWPKPGGRTPMPKISYVKLYEPWGWIIGSGVYVDDVKRDMAQFHWITICATILFAIITLSLAYLIGRGITRPLEQVINGLHEIASGKGDVDLTKRIRIPSRNEIGLLSSEFNALMESIHGMTMFKKVIEEDESLEDVYVRLAQVFSDAVGLTDFIIYEVDAGQHRMRPVYPPWVEESELLCSSSILDQCDLCKAKKTGHQVSSLSYRRICMQYSPQSDQAHTCLPIIVGGRTIGVVQFLHRQPADDDAALELRRKLHKAAQYLKESFPVIETKTLLNTLRQSALTDPLTGLRNRRFLQEYTENLVAGAQRRGKSIGLVMCDLDYFKQVNDTHGHPAGDIVLKETAHIISSSVRSSDIVIRFGGEEFLVVLIDIQADETIAVAEKIRAAVEAARFRLPEVVLQKTISAGVSEFPPDAESFWQAIKYADVALYKAKEAGRNRVLRFTKGMWQDEQF